MAASDPNLYAFELIFKGLTDSKTPVSKSKIQSITEHAIRACKYYKHVVLHIENFIKKSSPKHKLPGIYVVDSILRISRRKGKERDVFSTRFAKNLPAIFSFASKCAEEDKFKVFRCFKLWKEGHFFPSDVIDPIVDKIASIESFENVGGAVNNDTDPQDTENDRSLRARQNSPIQKNQSDQKAADVPAKLDSPAVVRSRSQEKPEKVRFDKRLLDFDYSDEEDPDGQRSGRRSKKKATEEEEFFTMGKDGKPEFAIDKIMSGLRQSRASQPLNTPHVPASPQAPPMETEDEDGTNEMELSSPGPEHEMDVSVSAAVPELTEEKPIVLRSCTVWVGHLPKGVTESELKKAMSEYGAVSTLDHIPPRGCAYVAYEKRRHAESAVKNRRDFYKQFGDKVKISWGLGRGIKSGYKQWNWDVDLGICEILPSLLPTNCKGLAEGCELVMDSVPDRLKARFSGKEAEEPKPAMAPEASGHSTGWGVTAAAGFAPVPLETHISTWNALLQSQALAEPTPSATASLPLSFDALRPPVFPPFFVNSPNPAVTLPPSQNGLAIPTVTAQNVSTSWKDPVLPKSSLFSQMKAAEEFPDPFTGLTGEKEAPSSISNPLFSKPPPPLGVPQFCNPTLSLGQPPILNPSLFFSNLSLPNITNQFSKSNNNNNSIRMAFNNAPRTQNPVTGIRPGAPGAPPPLPVFLGLGLANRPNLPSAGFQGMDLNSLGGRSRFGNGPQHMNDHFNDNKDNNVNRFAGADIRVPVGGMNMGNVFGNRSEFSGGGGGNSQNDGPRLPVWNPTGSMGPPLPRMDDRDFGGNRGRDRDRDVNRRMFPDDDRSHFQNQNNGSGNRQNFHNDNDNRERGFQNNNGNFHNNNSNNNRSFDGPDFARRPFQQQRGSR